MVGVGAAWDSRVHEDVDWSRLVDTFGCLCVLWERGEDWVGIDFVSGDGLVG